MNTALRQMRVLIRYEFSDALRTRRVILVMILFSATLLASFHFSIRLLHRMENQLAEMMELPASEVAGATTEALWQSERFRNIVERMTGDRDVVRELMDISPIALMFGGLSFFFTPLLVLLTCAPRISSEVSDGSARYALVRTSRLNWVLSKLAGQALLIMLALVLCAVGAWIMAWFQTVGGRSFSTGMDMLTFSLKAWVKGFAFLGLALGVSQCMRSPNLATAVSFVAWIGLAVLYNLSESRVGEGMARLWDLGLLLTPGGHQADLWRTNPVWLIPSVLYMLGLGFLYFFIGFIRFRRKDL